MASPRPTYPKHRPSGAHPIGDTLEHDDKKHRPSIFITIQGWILRFRILPLPIKIIFGYLTAAAMMVVTAVWCLRRPMIIPESLYNTNFQQGNNHNSKDNNNTFDLLLSSPKSHPTPRILQLFGGANNNYGRAVRLTSDKLPKAGRHPLIERYNPLPHYGSDVIHKLKRPETMDRGKCQPLADWQSGHNPTCNSIHEMSRGWQHLLNDRVDAIDNVDDDRSEQARLVASGSFRDVWMIRDYDGTTKRALKTLRWCDTCHYDLRNMDRHRRDAVAFDQLTASDLVVNTYGYCVNSGLSDWGEGGDLTRIFERDGGNNTSKETLLHIAYNVSMSLVHAHNFDAQGRPTIAHTDIKVNQFLYQGGYYQLTDFNRVRFLLWNKDENSQCGFTVGKNGGAWRSPEEYAYEEETEKVDVYSLGNILYFLLVRHNPWEGYKSDQVAELVKNQKRPPFPKDLVESTDIYETYMLKAIHMAFTYNKTQRPNAFEIAKKLQEGIGKLEKQR